MYQPDPDLKNRLKRAGLSYIKAAALIGISPTGVSNKLNGWSRLFDHERSILENAIRAKNEVNHA